jgi:hypothetical protein
LDYLDLIPKHLLANLVVLDLKQTLFKNTKFIFYKKKILKYLLAFGFGGFPNLTSLSVDHAIPVFINGTG